MFSGLVDKKYTQPYNIYETYQVNGRTVQYDYDSITIDGVDYYFKYLFQATKEDGIIKKKMVDKAVPMGTGRFDVKREEVNNPNSYFYLPIFKKVNEELTDNKKKTFDPTQEYLTILFVEQVCRKHNEIDFYPNKLFALYYKPGNTYALEESESEKDRKFYHGSYSGGDEDMYFYKLAIPVSIKNNIVEYSDKKFKCANYGLSSLFCSIPNTSADKVWGKVATENNCRSCKAEENKKQTTQLKNNTMNLKF